MNRQSRSRPGRDAGSVDHGAPLSPLASAGTGVGRPRHGLLAILLAVYVALAGIHASLVPTGQTGYQNAPDEAAHVNYVRILATGRLPTPQDAARDPQQRSYEWHQPPLYYALAVSGLPAGTRGLRAISIACGVAAICLIYLCAWRLFPAEPAIALLAAGIAALTPGHIAVTSSVNNDALLEVCCSAAVLALIIALRNGFSLWRAGWLGVAIGAAMLTKLTGLLLLPVLVVALLLLRRGGESTQALLRGCAWCLFVATALCGWWYVRNALVFHEVLPLKAFAASFSGTKQAADVAHRVGGWDLYWRDSLLMTCMSFWAVYGTPALAAQGIPGFLPDAIYQVLAIVCVVATGGLLKLHLRRRELTDTQQRAMWIMFALLTLVGLAFLSFLSRYFQTQGRYLYPAMVTISTSLAIGWREVFPQKYRGAASALLLAVLATVTAVYLFAVQAATG